MHPIALTSSAHQNMFFFPLTLGDIILNHREPVIRDSSGWVLGFFRGHEVVTVTVLAFGDREVPGNSCNPHPHSYIIIYIYIPIYIRQLHSVDIYIHTHVYIYIYYIHYNIIYIYMCVMGFHTLQSPWFLDGSGGASLPSSKVMWNTCPDILALSFQSSNSVIHDE